MPLLNATDALHGEVGDKLTHRDLAYKVIRRSILLGHTKRGTRINERVLAEKLGISRVPVREALLCLHGEGLLSKSKCGLEVTRLSPEDVLYQIEFRAIIDCSAVRLAAERITSGELQRLQEVVSHQLVLEHDEDWQAFKESDLIFHQLLRQASHNPFIIRLSGTLAMGLVEQGTRNDNVVEGHREILKAVADTDPDTAERLMYEHVVSNNHFFEGDLPDSSEKTKDDGGE